MADNTRLLTPIGVMCFPALFVPRAPNPANPSGDPRYQLMLVFDKAAQATPEFAALKDAVRQVAVAKFGPAPKGLRSPFRVADEKEQLSEFHGKGCVFIQPWSKFKPGLVDRNGQDIIMADDVWAGQTARATVQAFAYENSGNRGANFSLNNVQVVQRNRPRIDGRVSAAAEFAKAGGDLPPDDDGLPAVPGAGAGADDGDSLFT